MSFQAIKAVLPKQRSFSLLHSPSTFRRSALSPPSGLFNLVQIDAKAIGKVGKVSPCSRPHGHRRGAEV